MHSTSTCVFYRNVQIHRQYPSMPNQPVQSCRLTPENAGDTIFGKSPETRHSHWRKSTFTFDHRISIGFMPGRYHGRYRSSMPAARSISAASLSGRRYICSHQISRRSPRRYAFFVALNQQLPRLIMRHFAHFSYIPTPYAILYHSLLQLSRVAIISEVAMNTPFGQTEIYIFVVEKQFDGFVVDSVHHVYIINERIHTGTLFMRKKFHSAFGTFFAFVLHLVT